VKIGANIERETNTKTSLSNYKRIYGVLNGCNYANRAGRKQYDETEVQIDTDDVQISYKKQRKLLAEDGNTKRLIFKMC
jgi:hypothetical protein